MEVERTLILDHNKVKQKIVRIAHEIYETNFEEKELILVGIVDRGLLLAQRISSVLQEISDINIRLFSLEMNKDNPLDSPPNLQLSAADVKDKVVILVDDVLNSGRTLIYGAKPILELPVKRLTTVVLVNRRHRKFPIRADYVGTTLATTMQEHISVVLGNGGQDAVYLS